MGDEENPRNDTTNDPPLARPLQVRDCCSGRPLTSFEGAPTKRLSLWMWTLVPNASLES